MGLARPVVQEEGNLNRKETVLSKRKQKNSMPKKKPTWGSFGDPPARIENSIPPVPCFLFGPGLFANGLGLADIDGWASLKPCRAGSSLSGVGWTRATAFCPLVTITVPPLPSAARGRTGGNHLNAATAEASCRPDTTGPIVGEETGETE